MNGEGVIVYANQRFAEMLQTPLAEITGSTIYGHILETSLQGCRALLEQAAGGSGKGEFYLRSEDGRSIPAYFSLSALKLEGFEGVCGVVTDLTEQKRHQELVAAQAVERVARVEAESSRRRIASILEGITDCFLAMDREWRITDVNQRAASVFKRNREDLIGKVIWEFLPEVTGSELIDQYRRAMAERIAIHFEASMMDVGKWFETHVYPFSDGISVYFRDITDRKVAEKERERLLASEQEARQMAEAANRVKDDFLATLSHELRTPLNAILGWAQLLDSDTLDQEMLTHAVQVIRRNAKVQVQIIEDILDVSRIIAHKFHLEKRIVDLAHVVRTAIETTQQMANAKDVRISADLGDSRLHVLGDPIRLQQVVWNLLTNAIKFTSSGGGVAVKLERSKSEAGIIVSDTGEGISPEFLPFVFDPFRQRDSSYSRKSGGLGLGLAIVRHVVDLHSGTIEVWSDGEGTGSTFTVTLPLTPADEVSGLDEEYSADLETRQSSGTERLNGLRVLVVEDDADTRDMMTVVLESHGASVKAVASANEGFRVLQGWQPDLLLSDIGMPDEDGYALMERIRALDLEKGGKVLAIALTGYAGDEAGSRALLAGYQKYVVKPVEPEQIVEAIEDLLRQAKPRPS
jgi:PAS domain S-box-containing protein